MDKREKLKKLHPDIKIPQKDIKGGKLKEGLVKMLNSKAQK